MLILSNRHTRADLARWREYASGDESIVPRLDEAETISQIAAWQGDYCGTSWGKDSVVMMNLLYRSGNRVPCVYMRLAGHRDNPDCEAVRDAFLSRYDVPYEERTFVYEQCKNNEHWKALDREFGPRRMTGLRGDESTTRRMSIGVFGLDTGRSFRPIGHWMQDDVWGYLSRHDLPIHPAYAMLGGGRWDRQYLRVHSIGGERGTERGRREWEQEYYGDVLARIGMAKPDS